MVLLLALLLSSFAVVSSINVAVAQKAPDDIYNCSDFQYQEDAQEIFKQDPSDPNRLDGDNDGVACEGLPSSSGLPDKTPLILVPGIAGSKLEYAKSGTKLNGEEFEEGDEKWPRIEDTALSLLDGHLEDLRLAPDGEQPYSDDPKYATEVGGIWREEKAFGETFDEYQTTIATLTEEHEYTEGQDLFVFPYDWRKDIGVRTDGASQSAKLLDKIDRVRNDTGSEKVNILAHSQGGLVTLAALRNSKGSGKVDKVMTLGTPVLGATQSLAVFNRTDVPDELEPPDGIGNQYACFGPAIDSVDLRSIEFSLDSCAINGGTARTLFQNFPGAYQLFLSSAFHEAEGSPIRVASDPNAGPGTPQDEYDYELRDLPYSEWSSEVKDRGNASLVEEAGEFHNRYDDLSAQPLADPSVEIVRVVGDGIATPDYILKTNRFCGGNGPCSYTELRYTREGSAEGGDGTVPLHSADLYNPDTGFDLRGGAQNYYATGVEHGELQKDPGILKKANSYFNEESEENAAQRASIRDRQPLALALMDFLKIKPVQAQSERENDVAEQNDEFGLRTQPTPFGGVELQTIGSVQGRVEDESGNVLGALPDAERGRLPEGFIVEEIEGGDYNRIGEDPSQSFFLNEAGSYTSTLEIEERDDLEIKVKTYKEGKSTGQAIFYLNRLVGGELPQGARVELDFQSRTDLDTLKLQIDEDADGTPDRQLAPHSVVSGAKASDQTPPTTTATTRIVEPKRGPPRPKEAKVTLDAEDEVTGSGIGAIYYRIDSENKLRLYEDPFTIPLNTTIHYGAVDEAGNASPLQKLLVDDASDSLDTAEPVSTKDRIKRYIDPQGDEDWFVFETDGSSRYTVQLHGLPANYDLSVHDRSGKEINSSQRTKKKTEKLSLSPSAGRYYIKVSGHEGARSEKLPYHLKVG